MPENPLTLPADPDASAALAARGLRLGLVDPADAAGVRAWIEADARGFHQGAPSDEFVREATADAPAHRSTGIWDDALADPAVPVATITAWEAPLTVPGGAEVPSWAISGVTVAPTHRRRGIARAMLEAELRTASAAGLPLAILTVSEATIYGRYGFGPATWTTGIEVDPRRAGWAGGEVPGRVQLVGRDTAMAAGRELLERVRRATPGDVPAVGSRFDRLFGAGSEPEEQKARRFARYDDEDGAVQGLVVYRVKESPADFTDHAVDVRILVAATDDASAALWRFVLELDLISTVTADLRPVDEPLRWLVRDPRMVRTRELREHLWVRVLDPVAAFEGRGYESDGRLHLTVADPLGYASGEWLLTVDGGRAALTAGAAPDGVPALAVPVEALGSLHLGGASAIALARAGRLAERAPGDAAAADRLLRTAVAPFLSTWF